LVLAFYLSKGYKISINYYPLEIPEARPATRGMPYASFALDASGYTASPPFTTIKLTPWFLFLGFTQVSDYVIEINIIFDIKQPCPAFWDVAPPNMKIGW
jgi:hypothetical protein